MQDKDDHSWLRQGSTSSAEVAKTYDDWAATYNETLADWDYRAPGYAARLLQSHIPPASVIIDAGCGTGLAGTALRDAGFTGPIDGIDISPSSLRQAEQRDVYRHLETANLQALPLDIADDIYDGLVCIGVLTYVPDSEAVLREFARIVRPGGTVLVTQRDNLYRERAFGKTIKALADAGILGDVVISDPQPYLPDNPEFGLDITVVYAAMAIA